MVLLLLCPIAFSSCGDDNDEPDKPNNENSWNNKILGIWQLDTNEYVESDNLTVGFIKLIFSSQTEVEVILGTSSSTSGGGGGADVSVGPYTYQMQGDRIRFVNSVTKEVSEIKYEINGDKLQLTLKEGYNFPIYKSFEGPTSAQYTRYEAKLTGSWTASNISENNSSIIVKTLTLTFNDKNKVEAQIIYNIAGAGGNGAGLSYKTYKYSAKDDIISIYGDSDKEVISDLRYYMNGDQLTITRVSGLSFPTFTLNLSTGEELYQAPDFIRFNRD